MIRAKGLKELRKVPRKGTISPDQRIGDRIVFDIDDDGNAKEAHWPQSYSLKPRSKVMLQSLLHVEKVISPPLFCPACGLCFFIFIELDRRLR
jgi:hypothetical protein